MKTERPELRVAYKWKQKKMQMQNNRNLNYSKQENLQTGQIVTRGKWAT